MQSLPKSQCFPGKREVSEAPIQIRDQCHNASRMCWLSIFIMVPIHCLVQSTFRTQSLGQVNVWVALSEDHQQCKGAVPLDCTSSKPYQNVEKSQGKTRGSKRNKELACQGKQLQNKEMCSMQISHFSIRNYGSSTCYDLQLYGNLSKVIALICEHVIL